MIKILLILSLLVSQFAQAECNWKDIRETQGGYIYTKELHLCVGNLVQENESLKKVIELKDLALDVSEKRTELWLKTSSKAYDSLNQYENLRTSNQLLYFGLGVATTVLAVWAASQLHVH